MDITIKPKEGTALLKFDRNEQDIAKLIMAFIPKEALTPQHKSIGAKIK